MKNFRVVGYHQNLTPEQEGELVLCVSPLGTAFRPERVDERGIPCPLRGGPGFTSLSIATSALLHQEYMDREGIE